MRLGWTAFLRVCNIVLDIIEMCQKCYWMKSGKQFSDLGTDCMLQIYISEQNRVILKYFLHLFDDLIYLFPKLENTDMCEISKGTFGESEKL